MLMISIFYLIMQKGKFQKCMLLMTLSIIRQSIWLHTVKKISSLPRIIKTKELRGIIRE